MSFEWSEAALNDLRRMHEAGRSFGDIAATLGCTRNSAIGKARRLELPERRKAKPGVRLGRPRNCIMGPRQTVNRIAARTNPVPQKPPAPVVEIDSRPCTLLDLREDSCRWPLWGKDAKEGFYCGGTALPGLPYCGCHARMAYGK